MIVLLGGFLKNLPSPLVLIAAAYIGLRSLEIAFRPQEAFRTRAAHRVMTLSATSLFLLAVLFVVGEILGAAGVIALPWSANPVARF
jgi:hypothetical protein